MVNLRHIPLVKVTTLWVVILAWLLWAMIPVGVMPMRLADGRVVMALCPGMVDHAAGQGQGQGQGGPASPHENSPIKQICAFSAAHVVADEGGVSSLPAIVRSLVAVQPVPRAAPTVFARLAVFAQPRAPPLFL